MEPKHFKRAARPVTVAATQFSCSWDADANMAKAEAAVREAARKGAQIILLPELFETPYFCIEQDVRHLALAQPLEQNRAVQHFAKIARELEVVLPVSFFERAGRAYYNSIAIVDADGRVMGVYRKAHIPERARVPGEELLQPRRHAASRFGIRVMRASASASAGISGSRRRRAQWR